MKKTLLFLFFLLLSYPIIAQKGSVRQADKHFSAHNFSKAAQMWQKAYMRTENLQDKQLLAFRIGSAYHRMNRFEDALQWYTDAIGENPKNSDWILAQADAFLRSGNLESAKKSAEQALKLNPVSSEVKKILKMIENYKLHSQISDASIEAFVGVNTEWSDYSPAWLNGDLVITSSRKEGSVKGHDGRTAEDFSRLYLFISNLYGDLGNAILLPVGGNMNAGTLSFDKTNERVFFTRCYNRKRKCTIMEAGFNSETFAFSKAKPAAFVNRKHNFGHPHVREDGKKMYFSANLPGGYGGNDLYSITIKTDGSFGLPVNLGAVVNTEFDELFPTTAGDSLLFFSSYGHPGFGGLDIFYAFDRAGNFNEVQILSAPYNSPSDDFGLTMKKGATQGVLSSNRNRSSGDDIFFFDDYPIRKVLKGVTIDAQTLNPIAGAEIKIQDNDGNNYFLQTTENGSFAASVPVYSSGSVSASHPDYNEEAKKFAKTEAWQEIPLVEFFLSRRNHPVGISGKVVERESGRPVTEQIVSIISSGGFLAMTKTNDIGVYTFDSLKVGWMYNIKIEKEGFFTESKVIRIPEVDKPMILQRSNGYDLDFELTAIELKKEITLNDIYYDFDKATLRESSKAELDKLVSMLRETPRVRVQISSHTDTRGTDKYNDKLSAARAKSVVDYLELNGISKLRLVSRGYGKRNPVIKNATNEAEHQANRRTTFQVLDMNAKIENNVTAPDQTEKSQRLVYRVQILASSVKRNPDNDFGLLKGLVDNIRFIELMLEGVFRYEVGDRNTISEAEALRNRIRNAGFPDAFIVPYIDGERVSLQQAKDFRP
jgi:peptidoglycan-associated lipoprotein